MRDTFSVAMCTYNGARYLGEQLTSIATQTRLPDELVICDDRSSDDTVRIIEQFKTSAPFKVRLGVNFETLGSTRNFEKAIGLCEGALIALADQDDIWLPQKLELIETRFQQTPAVGLIFSDAELVDENLVPLGERLWNSIGFDENARQGFNSERALDVLLPGWVVTGATMAFRSRFKALALPIPDNLPIIHDGWIAALIAAVAEVEFIEQPLIRYRLHQQQQIGVPKAGVAPQRQNMRSFTESIRRLNSYSHLISIGHSLRTRLAERSTLFDSAAALRKLDARLGHLRARNQMPKRIVNRLPIVFRELVTQRYHLYSNGVYSALKDLLNQNG